MSANLICRQRTSRKTPVRHVHAALHNTQNIGRAAKSLVSPSKAVIRMLGPDCFAAINERGHQEALREFREEQEQQRLDAYLQSHLSLVPDAQHALKTAIPIARAVDNARKTLSTHISDGLDFVLWDQVQEGMLRYCDAAPETLEGGRPTKDDMKLYGPAAGYRMLDPKARPLAPELEKIYESFKPIHYGSDHQCYSMPN
jgi:hypothetical protein